MGRLTSTLVITLFALSACTASQPQQAEPDSADTQPTGITDATALAQSALIVDTHIDVPYRIFRNPADVGGVGGMRPYADYQDTLTDWVGRIPAAWETIS